MNILFTESSPHIGGQELQTVAQMVAIRKKGHSVLLVCREKSKIASEAKKQNIDVIFVPFKNSLHISSVVKLLGICQRFRPHVVICHSGHDSNIVGLTRLLCWKDRFRIIRQKTYLTKRTKNFSLNYLCDDIIVPGEATRKHLMHCGVRTNITIVPPGFDFDKIYEESHSPVPPHIKAWLADSGEGPVIVQIGMLRPEKGHEFMLNLLFRLKKEGRKFRWLVVGSGSVENERRLRAIVDDLDMHDNVLISGGIFPVSSIYKIANLIVMPSENESFGMVAAEASVFSIPVFANHVGGLPDVIQHNRTGTLLPAGDMQVWRSALNDFFERPEHFCQMAHQAKYDVANRFDINKTVSIIPGFASCE
ncbi:glycosyltransferase family 4 protein [Escherichia fergusonii]|uniref:glycosyltransferase family 4 protein n=1 Tax=Escherichia fergusonii TaxID=564 RepID=UPI001E565E09|nr:glycosyltransferase family 4 protein [Escherichia fergusonii]MCC8283413.1 glycosyltransferase family 4 protein [Escherichia fergusonii]MCC8291836.1 glycosyltransferase family 4 protein [Escherichia fergusonii]MCC8317641.1 glycosyltransferase family 4 protein [Escherichia fergusonii]